MAKQKGRLGSDLTPEEVRGVWRDVGSGSYSRVGRYEQVDGKWREVKQTEWGVIGCFVIPVVLLVLIWIAGGGLTLKEQQTPEQRYCARQGITCDDDGDPVGSEDYDS